MDCKFKTYTLGIVWMVESTANVKLHTLGIVWMVEWTASLKLYILWE